MASVPKETSSYLIKNMSAYIIKKAGYSNFVFFFTILIFIALC